MDSLIRFLLWKRGIPWRVILVAAGLLLLFTARGHGSDYARVALIVFMVLVIFLSAVEWYARRRGRKTGRHDDPS